MKIIAVVDNSSFYCIFETKKDIINFFEFLLLANYEPTDSKLGGTALGWLDYIRRDTSVIFYPRKVNLSLDKLEYAELYIKVMNDNN